MREEFVTHLVPLLCQGRLGRDSLPFYREEVKKLGVETFCRKGTGKQDGISKSTVPFSGHIFSRDLDKLGNIFSVSFRTLKKHFLTAAGDSAVM